MLIIVTVIYLSIFIFYNSKKRVTIPLLRIVSINDRLFLIRNSAFMKNIDIENKI